MLIDVYNQGEKLYLATSSYKELNNEESKEWYACPNCGLKPLVWISNNGRKTACGCGNNIYDHFSIEAESIMSIANRNNGNIVHYDINELRDNWNHWVKTGEYLFNKENGRW